MTGRMDGKDRHQFFYIVKILAIVVVGVGRSNWATLTFIG